MSGFSNYAENKILDHAMADGAWTMPAGSFLQLHTADPTDNGTAGVAGNATRKSVSWAAAANGVSPSDADLDWTAGQVTTTETYTHYSLWDASTGGNCIGAGTIAGGAATAGNAFKIASSDLTFNLD